MEINRRKALGRGLEELFNNEPIDYTKIEEKVYSITPKEEIIDIDLNDLRANPYQPRKVFDEKSLEELANSIREHGVIQPIIAKKSIKGYEIIAGERRVKASKIVGLEKIPAIVRDFTDTEMMEIALLENLQRENLNIIEEAEAYQRLTNNLNLTQEELAKRVGKSRSHITNIIGLLNLSSDAKKLVLEDKLTMGHARVISKLSSPTEQKELIDKILKENLTVRDIEELARPKEREKETKRTKINQEYSYLESLLVEKLNTKVKIRNNKINIDFENKDDLERIIEVISK